MFCPSLLSGIFTPFIVIILRIVTAHYTVGVAERDRILFRPKTVIIF